MANGTPGRFGLTRFLMPVLVLLTAAVPMVFPALTPAPAAMFEDDLYYYLVVARRLLAGQGFSFDGIHLTNGYHPLWMLICVAMSALFHGNALLLALGVLDLGCVLLTYFLIVDCMVLYAGVFTSQCVAALLALGFAYFNGGMEVTLAVPLMLLLFRFRLKQFHWSPKDGFLYGLLGAAVILARLDAALMVVLMASLDMVLSRDIPWAQRARTILPFVGGMLPVIAYLLFNQIVFGTAMPISSHAKQLRFHHSFTPLAFYSYLHVFTYATRFMFRVIGLGIVVSIILVVLRGAGKLRPEHRPLVWALLLFAPLHLLVLCFASDWPVWGWYTYPYVAGGLGASMVLLSRNERWIMPLYPYASVVPLLLFLLMACHGAKYSYDEGTNLKNGRYSFYAAAVDLQKFAETHPGIYGMGDRAGMVAYYMQDPIVQTEGLMMDKPFLENIKLQRNLNDVLHQYQVRYFVATNPVPDGSCVLVREPIEAGPDAPAMHGRFCSKPIHVFTSASRYTNEVFDMSKE